MSSSQSSKTTLIAAWIIILLASLLPKIVLQELFSIPVSFGQQTALSLGVILLGFLAALVWKPLRPLWQFLVLLAVLVSVQWLVFSRIAALPAIHTRMASPSFSVSLLTELALKLGIMLAVIATLLLMKKKFADFYLVRGDLAAPAGRVRWLGIPEGTPWRKLGPIVTVCISLGTLTFLFLSGRPSLESLSKLLPYLPAVFLAAAMNAIYEEVTYKAAFLSVLESPLSPPQALYMVAVYFGIMHFYGVPYGVIGVVLAGFLGWLLAKSMQETRGIFWAWFIHFWQDVWIFAFLAVNMITPGGG